MFTSVGNKAFPVVAVVALAVSAGTAVAGGQARNTDADYTPFAAFTPLATSAECAVGPVVGDPFTLPSGYGQQVIVQEGDGGSIDLFDMLTQNETGKDKGPLPGPDARDGHQRPGDRDRPADGRHGDLQPADDQLARPSTGLPGRRGGRSWRPRR